MTVIVLIIFLTQIYLTAQVVTNVAPLKPGNKWIYYSYVVFQGSIEKYEVIDSLKMINDIQFFTIYNTPYNDITYTTLLDNGFFARYDESMPDSLYKYFKMNPKLGDEWQQNLANIGTTLYSTIIDTFSAPVFNKITLIFVVDRTDSGVVGSREYWTEEFGMLNGLYEQAEDILKGCVIDGVIYGDTSTVGIEDEEDLTNEFMLYQNYPNPFNSNTVISWQLPSYSIVELKIFDLLGREVETLVNQYYSPGKYHITFQIKDLPSGIYLYRIVTDNFSKINKMIYLK